MKGTRLSIVDTTALNLHHTVDLWLEHLEARGCSPNTLAVYRFIMNTFLREVGNIPLPDVTPDTIRRYLIARRRQGLSPQTIAGNYRTLSSFFAWCARQDLLDVNPCEAVEAPKREKVVKKALTPEEVEKLLRACDGKDFVSVRNHALLLVLLDSGMRIAECHQLRVGDIGQESIIIRGKGGKWRHVFLHSDTRLALLRYAKMLGNLPADAPLWWCRGKGEPMALEGLKRAVEYIGKRAGVHVSAHMLRRSFAVWSLKQGLNMEYLRLLLGHADLQTTQVYLSFVEDDLRQAHQQHSPLNLLQKARRQR